MVSGSFVMKRVERECEVMAVCGVACLLMRGVCVHRTATENSVCRICARGEEERCRGGGEDYSEEVD